MDPGTRPTADEVKAMLGFEPHPTCGFVVKTYRIPLRIPADALPDAPFSCRERYLCGSGSHPGPGVSMAPGRNAAETIFSDLGLDFGETVATRATRS